MKQEQTSGHRHHHHHEEFEDFERRSGRNRRTHNQKRRKLIANILFAVLSVIATAIIAFCIYIKLYGIV